VELSSTHRDLSKNDFFKILSNSFGLRQNFWPYFLTNHHFWEICSYQSKDLLNPCLFRWFSEFKKIPTGLNKLVYKFVDFSCPQLYQYINLLQLMYSCEIWADADPFCAGADPCIRNFVGHPRYVSEICLTSMLCIGNHTTMLPIY
jgi:hypothetical protein